MIVSYQEYMNSDVFRGREDGKGSKTFFLAEHEGTLFYGATKEQVLRTGSEYVRQKIETE